VTLRRLKTYLVVTILVAFAGVAGVVAAGDEPVLGLDLQGGISIAYEAVGQARPGALDVARDIIEERVNGLGVSQAEITREDRTITVNLPGVSNRDEAARIVGQTGELRFRGVLAVVGPKGQEPEEASTTTSSGAVAPTTTTTTTPPSQEALRAAIKACDTETVSAALAAGEQIPTTSFEDNKRKDCVVLRERESRNRIYLGPTEATGGIVQNANSEFAPGQGYAVNVNFTSEGSVEFDTIAAKYVQQQLAIVLDDRIQSAPVIQEASFQGTAQITGDFTVDEADELAKVINYGALPVRLEKLNTVSLSPTLGRDQLDAGIAAGAIGLILVAGYMLIYYRLLGAVVIAGLLLTGMLTYALITFLGSTVNLALDLAGVTGLIVSIGVAVDSYVVYFERLKDEVRTGKTVRSSVDRGFTRSFRTILAADLVSIIGAAALFFVAAGSVRGFAFFLGLSTFLDLLVGYFFMHPAVSLLARRPALVRMRGVGIAAGLDAPGVQT